MTDNIKERCYRSIAFYKEKYYGLQNRKHIRFINDTDIG